MTGFVAAVVAAAAVLAVWTRGSAGRGVVAAMLGSVGAGLNCEEQVRAATR